MTTKWEFTFEDMPYIAVLSNLDSLPPLPKNPSGRRTYANDIIIDDISQSSVRDAIRSLRITTSGLRTTNQFGYGHNFQTYNQYGSNITGFNMLVMSKDDKKRLYFSCSYAFDDITYTMMIWNIAYSDYREKHHNVLFNEPIKTYDIGLYFAASFSRARYNNLGRVLVVNEFYDIYQMNNTLSEHKNIVKLYINKNGSFVIDRKHTVNYKPNTEEDHTAMIFHAHDLMDVVMEKQIRFLAVNTIA